MRVQRFHACGSASGRKKGFSLAELMVVIVILGLLATIVVPNVLDRLKVAQRGKAAADITALADAVTTYAIENAGKWPESLEVLILPDENGRKFLTGYDSVPLDPWSHEYQYDPPQSGAEFKVYTLGADGSPGGEGDDADISNWDVKQGRKG